MRVECKIVKQKNKQKFTARLLIYESNNTSNHTCASQAFENQVVSTY